MNSKALSIIVTTLCLSALTSAQTVFNGCSQLPVTPINIFCNTPSTSFPTRQTSGTIASTILFAIFDGQTSSSIPSGTFTGLTITTLILTNNSISLLDDNSFTGATSIQSLSFAETSLSNITSAAFTPLASTLTDLSFANSALTATKMTDISPGLQSLTALTTLTLDNNNILTLVKTWISGLTALQTFSAKSNGLLSVAADTFSSNTALKSIDLSSNSLSDMSTLLSAVSGLSGVLETLTLSNNNFASIVDFPSMTALKTLDLSNNQISSVASTNTFTNAAALTSISLAGNQLTAVPSIASQTALLSLDLSNMATLSTIADNSFSRSVVPTAGVNVDLSNDTVTFANKAFCHGVSPYYNQITVRFNSLGSFNKCLFKQMKNANAGLRATFFVGTETGVTDYTSFCNCDNKVFATNNQVDLGGACANFTDACTTTTYTDNCAADFTCATTTTSGAFKVKFEYLGFLVMNALFMFTYKQF